MTKIRSEPLSPYPPDHPQCSIDDVARFDSPAPVSKIAHSLDTVSAADILGDDLPSAAFK